LKHIGEAANIPANPFQIGTGLMGVGKEGKPPF